jgi:hypothetical protein
VEAEEPGQEAAVTSAKSPVSKMFRKTPIDPRCKQSLSTGPKPCCDNDRLWPYKNPGSEFRSRVCRLALPSSSGDLRLSLGPETARSTCRFPWGALLPPPTMARVALPGAVFHGTLHVVRATPIGDGLAGTLKGANRIADTAQRRSTLLANVVELFVAFLGCARGGCSRSNPGCKLDPSC